MKYPSNNGLGFEIGEGQYEGVEALATFFARVPRFALAFSGGCDSSFLLASAVQAGCEVGVYSVKSAFQTRLEIKEAEIFAIEWGVAHTVIELDVFASPDICRNSSERCYYCKNLIFSTIWERAKKDGFDVLADGTNQTDNPARRPGFRALSELGVLSPLRRAAISKEDVRELSRNMGLLTAEKPNFSCLAVHAPEGELLTPQVILQAAQTLGHQSALFDRYE